MICFDMASWYPKFDRIRHSICPHKQLDIYVANRLLSCRRCIKWTKDKQNFMTKFFYERQPVPRRHLNFLCSAKEALL
jgi:hypothetical protein